MARQVESVTLPAELVGAPARMTVLRMRGGPRGSEALLVAGPLPRRAGEAERFTVSALRTGWSLPLWAAARGSSAVGRADLVAAAPDDRPGVALMLLPRRALVALDPHAADPGGRSWLVARGRSLPVRLFAPDGAPVGVTLRADGETVLHRYDSSEGRRAQSGIAGPRLEPGQSPSALLRDPQGRLVMTADDSARGFQLWRQEDGTWRHLVGDGAARFGLNAAVLDAAIRGEGIVLAVGPSAAVQENLLGMPLRGELVTLDAGGRTGLLCGELRPGPGGLVVPRMTPAAMRDLDARGFVRVATAGDDLDVAVLRGAGVALCRIAGASGAVTVLDEGPGWPVAALESDGGKLRAILAEALETEDDEEEEEDDDGWIDAEDAAGDDDWAAFADALEAER